MSYEWIKPLEGETSVQYINRILVERPNLKDENNYQERHHISPRCVGGTDEDTNLVYLYAEEHYCIHSLLALENPDNARLVWAWNAMRIYSDFNFQRDIINLNEESEEFAYLRKLAFNHLHLINSKPVRCWETGEVYPSIVDAAKAKGGKNSSGICGCISGPNNTAYGYHWIYESVYQDKITKGEPIEFKKDKRGRKLGQLHTEETKQKMRENHVDYHGENNPNYGKHESEETKNKIRQSRLGKNIGKDSPVAVSIIADTGEIFETITAAAKWAHTSTTNIQHVLRGEQKTAAGHYWEYYEKGENIDNGRCNKIC